MGCVRGGSALCWPVCSLFSKRLQFSVREQKRASPSHFFPLPTPLDFSTQLIIHRTPTSALEVFNNPPSRLPTRPLLRINRGFSSHTVTAPSRRPRLNSKPAPPLPKPAPYEYGHSSSQPQLEPESSSALAPLSPLPLHRLSTVTSHPLPALQLVPHRSSRRDSPQHPTSQYTTQKLFMYQHDKIPVHRHSDPPLKLQLFRNPRKPCSPNPSPDG